MDTKSNRAASQNSKQANKQQSFASALAEIERKTSTRTQTSNSKKDTRGGQDIFQAGKNNQSGEKSIKPGTNNAENNKQNLFQELIKEREQKQKRLERHREVNPVDLHELYGRRSVENTKKINDIRKELLKLAQEVNEFRKEIDLALTKQVKSVGSSGVYHENFFAKLKQIIILLRQRVSSARSWARETRKKKAKRGQQRGLNFKANETEAAHDLLHHERSSAYAG